MRISGLIKKIGLFAVLMTLSFGIFTVSFTSNFLYAKTEVLFSPGGSIREAITRAIFSSNGTIDIAAFTFTAGEIAEALYKAKERGVVIRVVIDWKQDQYHYPAIEFLKEEGFNLQFIKGNIGGSMNNTFAIFDGKLIVTGSYNWTEYAEKFNYENALFIDDKDVVEKYKEEFESLYNKSVAQGVKRRKESVVTAEGSDKRAESKPGNNDKTENQKEANVNHKGETVALVAGRGNEFIQTDENKENVNADPDPDKQFVDISFTEFDKIFNNESKLEKAEKTRLWKDKFEGKYVRWTGKISFKGIAVYDWNKVGISHKEGGGDVDVNLKFDWSKQKKVMKLQVGDIVTYTGKLISLNSIFSSYRLEDVDVVQVR